MIALGRHNEALTLAQAAVAMLDKALGPEHQSTKDSASTCADALDELGRYASTVVQRGTPWAENAAQVEEKKRAIQNVVRALSGDRR